MIPPNISGSSDDDIRVENGYDAETPPSIAIVKAIAAIEDVDPVDSRTDLGIRLYDQIDPEALNRLVTDNGDVATVTVDLTIHDEQQYAVRIRDDGRLVVQKTH